MFSFPVFRRHRAVLAGHEQVEFYPSYGARTADGRVWRLVVQGCVFNPQLPWIRRRPVMAVIRRAMRVERAAEEFFRRRMMRFLLDASQGREISIQIDGQRYDLGESGKAGLFRQEINVPEEIVHRALADDDLSTRWLIFTAALAEGDARRFAGRVQLIEPEGVSIVSDVDDTIKHSNVPNRRDLFYNTFSREFRIIPGMPALYQACAQQGAVFHFVSGSPWQLYEPISEFFRTHGFPAGSFHLKPFRIRDSARKLRPSPQLAHKLTIIQPLLAAFPRRRFILIGDSGEQDPQIYGELLRTRATQIAGVFIRAVRGESAEALRIQQAFAGCPRERWTLYRTPADIHDAVLALVARESAAPP